MLYLICIVPAAPLRNEDHHHSEMVSQLLFGEMAELLEERTPFVKIRCLFDSYEGWCQASQLTFIEDDLVAKSLVAMTPDWDNLILCNGQPMHLSLGSDLGLLETGTAVLGKYNFEYRGKVNYPAKCFFSDAAITDLAMQYLNTPYLWGGRSVFGIDCSGFLQQVFRYFNFYLPRDAHQQAEMGELVGFLQEVLCGDVAFFDNAEGRIVHVGLLLSSDTIIHSSGKVRIDKIDNMGIVNTDTGVRTHQLRIIKRYFT